MKRNVLQIIGLAVLLAWDPQPVATQQSDDGYAITNLTLIGSCQRCHDDLRARADLLVTVPNYMRFEPWREVSG